MPRSLSESLRKFIHVATRQPSFGSRWSHLTLDLRCSLDQVISDKWGQETLPLFTLYSWLPKELIFSFFLCWMGASFCSWSYKLKNRGLFIQQYWLRISHRVLPICCLYPDYRMTTAILHHVSPPGLFSNVKNVNFLFFSNNLSRLLLVIQYIWGVAKANRSISAVR